MNILPKPDQTLAPPDPAMPEGSTLESATSPLAEIPAGGLPPGFAEMLGLGQGPSMPGAAPGLAPMGGMEAGMGAALPDLGAITSIPGVPPPPQAGGGLGAALGSAGGAPPPLPPPGPPNGGMPPPAPPPASGGGGMDLMQLARQAAASKLAGAPQFRR